VLARNASAHPQQVARIDDVPATPLPHDIERALLHRLAVLLPETDAVLVSNYRSGVVCRPIVRSIVGLAATHGVPTCVDTQGDLTAFRSFTLVKSNQPDAEQALRKLLVTEDDFAKAGRRLLTKLNAHAAVITRGSEGLSLIEAGSDHLLLPPTNRTDVWDVTGAGDTVIAVLALGLAAKSNLIETAQLANAAAGLVVRRIGVAAVTPTELAESLGQAP
jgi:rfaE bifunctional protein kinase chain/domain